jgi:hypothetical protein
MKKNRIQQINYIIFAKMAENPRFTSSSDKMHVVYNVKIIYFSSILLCFKHYYNHILSLISALIRMWNCVP